MNKADIRAQMRERRRQLTPAQQADAAQRVFCHLQSFVPYQKAEIIMAYIAARGELSLECAINDILLSGKTLVLPRCEQPGVMTARKITSLDQLRPGAYGLLEPAQACDIVSPDTVHLILVPGTAFDRKGGRIGQGGGYYDRFLPCTRALRTGICHDFALYPHLPLDAHDMRMDAIVTPNEVLDLR